jgi:hypothetical protein
MRVVLNSNSSRGVHSEEALVLGGPELCALCWTAAAAAAAAAAEAQISTTTALDFGDRSSVSDEPRALSREDDEATSDRVDGGTQ